MNYFISNFYCTRCGNQGIPLPRKKSSKRECAHLKKLYCCTCREQINAVEIKPFGSYTYENFIKDFKEGKFNET